MNTMDMEIDFKRIHNYGIFGPEFDDLSANGRGNIKFHRIPGASGGIAVVYAPNGTGKTSFTTVASATESSEDIDFTAVYDNQMVGPSDGIFHIIKDQVARNIIPGDTSDYLIGADIKREYQLRDLVEKGFNEAFGNDFPKFMKDTFHISRKNDTLLSYISSRDAYAAGCIISIVNKQDHGKSIDQDTFIEYISTPEHRATINRTLDADKRSFLIGDYAGTNKIIEQLLKADLGKIVSATNVVEIEQNADAIAIAKKYRLLHKCVVCDNPEYDAAALLARKAANRDRIYASLDENTRELLDMVQTSGYLSVNDPFNIKKIVMDFLATGNQDELLDLLTEFQTYIDSLIAEMINGLIDIFAESDMLHNYTEYKELQSHTPRIDSEELLFIKEVISSNIEADITIIRDEEHDNNFKLMLSGRPFLGEQRESLQLSTGEQNFISLAFEFLLARHSNKEIVIVDDPISSFDSVYKNKIAYCILKFLENKKQIILTHNTDLIRLLDVQLNNSFNLYMLSNSEGGNNGFVPVDSKEKKILINMYELLKLFRNEDGILNNIIRNRRQFLMSMIPFMRGYAHISANGNEIYCQLSELMHGYTNASENISEIYESLFGVHFDEEVISTEDILSIQYESIDIIDDTSYPLLAETLKQTLIYYHLRMNVEKQLVDVFNIPIPPGEVVMLNQLIRKAFRDQPGASTEEKERNRNYRVFFTSRKTLINEFNHFEGNMNIFQPAIDITPCALEREVHEITRRLTLMRTDFAS